MHYCTWSVCVCVCVLHFLPPHNNARDTYDFSAIRDRFYKWRFLKFMVLLILSTVAEAAALTTDYIQRLLRMFKRLTVV